LAPATLRCRENVQRCFLEAEGNFEEQVIALDLRNIKTQEAINKVKEALSSLVNA